MPTDLLNVCLRGSALRPLNHTYILNATRLMAGAGGISFDWQQGETKTETSTTDTKTTTYNNQHQLQAAAAATFSCHINSLVPVLPGAPDLYRSLLFCFAVVA